MARALLTSSQKKLLDLAVRGFDRDAIAAELAVHPDSVSGRLARARARLGARSNMELVAQAIAHGVVAAPLRRQPPSYRRGS